MEKSCRRMRRRFVSFICNNRCKVVLTFATFYHFIFFILYQEVDSKYIDPSQVIRLFSKAKKTGFIFEIDQ